VADRLGKATGEMKAATMWFMQNAMAKPNNPGAGSTDYLHLFGYVALGYMWGRMAEVAAEKLANGGAGDPFYEAKIVTARHFAERMLPETAVCLARIEAGADTLMALAPDAF